MLPYLLSFATGQSDPRGHALSPHQTDFLDALPAPEDHKLRRNFPWRDETPPWRDTPLIPASLNNYRQFLASRRASFAERHRPDLEAWAAKAEHHLVFAGSCGLELLCRLEPDPALCRRIHVFAYGPVIRKTAPFELFTVRGSRDWISALYVKHPDARVACNHLDYLEDQEVRKLAIRFLEQVLATRQTKAKTGFRPSPE